MQIPTFYLSDKKKAVAPVQLLQVSDLTHAEGEVLPVAVPHGCGRAGTGTGTGTGVHGWQLWGRSRGGRQPGIGQHSPALAACTRTRLGAGSSQLPEDKRAWAPVPAAFPGTGQTEGKRIQKPLVCSLLLPRGGFSFSSNLGRSQANRDSATERFATKISPEKSHLCPSADQILPPWSHPGSRRSPGWEQDTGTGTRVGVTPRHIGHTDPSATLLRSRAARFLGCRLFSSLHHLKHLEHGQPQTGSHCLFIQAFTTIEKMEYGYTELQTMRSKMCWFSSDETEFQTENSEDKKKEKYLKKKPTYSKGSQQATPETEDKRGNKEPQKSEGN